jgi:hypothetical protein
MKVIGGYCMKEIAKKEGVEIVLNGGKKEMDSATISIAWFFSPEVIAKKPTHLLFFEQTEAEAARLDAGARSVAGNVGRRFACKASKRIKSIRLLSSGYHRIVILVFAGKDAKWIVKKSLFTENKEKYVFSIDWENPRKYYGNSVVAFAVISFYVSEELFIAKPRVGFWEKICQYAKSFNG